MPEYSRVVTFDADSAALDALVNEINSAGAPPPGVPAKRITVLADRANGKVVVAIRFGSEEDLRTGRRDARGDEPSQRRRHAPRLRRCVRGRARDGVMSS